MEHRMFLTPQPMDMIKNREKSLELRLFDEKRQMVKVGDNITFISTQDENETLTVKVLGMNMYSSFEELYNHEDLLECGYTTDNIAEASPDDMAEYYSYEKQSMYGVVAIEVRPI